MIIKRIKLENIRSYLNETIEFPQGSVLLSGDIGSGKSTILLAIEFALFGTKRGELPAESLLRFGKNQGSVELALDLDGKEIIIKRVLKRMKDDIRQISGYIIKAGIKKELTALELRAEVLALLGYPKDLLTKTKDLIYRYTVYTPQESMKHIVFAEKEERLETLRKVFGIDKYKRIRENSQIVLKDIRDNLRLIQSSIADLDEKKRFVEKTKSEIKDLSAKEHSFMIEIKNLRQKIESQKASLTNFEEQILVLHKLNSTFNVENANLANKMNERSQLLRDIEAYDKNIKEFEYENERISAEYLQKTPQEIVKLIDAYKKKSSEIESLMMDMRSRVSEAATKKRSAQSTIQKVTGMNHCPLCLQRVEHSHKEAIRQKEEKDISEADIILKELESQEQQKKKELASTKQIMDDLRVKERNLAVLAQKRKNIESQNLLIDEKRKSIEAIKSGIGLINMRKKDLSEKIAAMKDIESEFKKAKQEHESSQNALKEEEIKKARVEKEMQGLQRLIDMAQKEIGQKLEQKQKLLRLKEIHNWIEDYFINVMEVIEKHVMVSIHNEFSQYFQNWFSILIEDEIINVSLDNQFTPVVIQNGYETNMDNLSGGEKTSVALSYRLSLNRIINDMISTIKTKDLLILDEPTDGFSSDQLDKVKDILDQLNNKQIIIVSHESKIESFVQNIIRVRKEEHVSKVIG